MKKISTGISGLDSMTKGGIPEKRICLVTGGPGVGKTIFGLQFLLKGVDNDENGLFITLEESPDHIKQNANGFGWSFNEKSHSKVSFLDVSPLQNISEDIKIGDIVIGNEKFSFASLLTMIKETFNEIEPKRIVLDSLTTLMFQFEDPLERRKSILELYRALLETGATCIATSEARLKGSNRVFQTEEFLSHGVITLFSTPDGVRILRIEKMRGIDHDLLPRPYIIGENGIEVYSKEKISRSTLSSFNFL